MKTTSSAEIEACRESERTPVARRPASLSEHFRVSRISALVSRAIDRFRQRRPVLGSVGMDALTSTQRLTATERRTLDLLHPSCRERYARALSDGRRLLAQTRLDREEHSDLVRGRAIAEAAELGAAFGDELDRQERLSGERWMSRHWSGLSYESRILVEAEIGTEE